MQMRRRQARKAELLDIEIARDGRQIPYIAGALRNIFCEVEHVLDSGDRRLYISRVVESRANQALAAQRPALFRDVMEAGYRFAPARRLARTVLALSGIRDLGRRALSVLRPPPPPDIARATYEMAGATEAEIGEILRHDVVDTSRHLAPPRAPAVLRREIGLCVVGTSWGSFHCRLVRQASPTARLFVCGQDPVRTARLARAVKADGWFLGLEKAVHDDRVQALTLALPHHLHRSAAEMVSAAGKHALVEKPLATTLVDADAMLAAARRAGTILMVAEDMHFRPAIREAVSRIERGDIGEPLYLLAHAGGVRRPRGWAADRDRMGGGVLMDIGVHYVRGLRLLMGEPDSVLATRAMQIDTRIGGEDSVQVIFASAVGWQAHMLCSWATNRGHGPDVIVLGDRGTFHLWPGARYLDYYPVAPRLFPRILALARPYRLRDWLLRPRLQRVRVRLPDRDGTGYVAEVREFLAAVAEERPPASSPVDARRDLEIVLRSYEALALGERLPIPSFIPS
jgi:predicted dehydrogenase